MNTPTIAAVERLAETDARTCLSLFMPTYQSGPEVRQNAIRFENLLKQARRQTEGDVLDQRFDELAQLVEDDEFWQHQSAGLAILADANSIDVYRVPLVLSERVVVGDGFDLLPLLPVLQNDGVFYIVAVSRDEGRLLIASRTRVTEFPADLPDGIDAVKGTLHHKGFGLHSFRVRAGASDAAVPHGHVEADEREQELRYLREIDERIGEVIGNRDATLLFAGVEETFAQFKEISEQRGLAGEAILGSPDRKSPEQLHARALPIVERLFAARIDEAVDRWRNALGGNLVLDDVAAIVSAAEEGRVDTLLFDADELLDRAVGQEVPDQEGHRYHQVARAAGRVLAAGGRVVAVPTEKMHGQLVAALLRYVA